MGNAYRGIVFTNMKVPKYITGIDPGASGGVVRLDEDGNIVSYQSFKNAADHYLAYIIEMHVYGNCHCYIEKVHAMPAIRRDKFGKIRRQGITSTFNFGRNYGMLLGAVYSRMGNTKVRHVTPQVWQASLGCLTGGDKKVTHRKAQEMFPDVKVTHQIADALLIAEYGRRQMV